ncbi:sensor histidine kinase [Microbacterium sp. VKM Ac-2870]|uniref:sensor histidine kinase n=1 Tax=Microbacterium sp. VKM Ac-2870 TaxID=2783825 RepID=UPI002B26EF67|nr:histidine kinase [Microbacterium sp. VKM Ac-2870]
MSSPDDTFPPPRPVGPAWIVDVVVVMFVVAAALAPVPVPEMRPAGPFVLALVLLPAPALLFRRRWPIVVLLVCTLVYVGALMCGTVSPGAVAVMLVAMYSVARDTSRRTALATVAVAVTVVVGVGLGILLATGHDPRFLQVGLALALAGAVGDAARSRREYLTAIVDRARRAEQTRDAEARRRVTEERLRIARDLHDAVAHQISVISLNAGVASAALDERPEKAREALSTIRTASRDVLGQIGGMLSVLRADETAALPEQPGLARLSELVESVRVAGLDVALRDERADVAVDALPLAVDIVAYRVIQEGLTNALKHGSGARAHILLRVDDDALEVVVTNPVAHAGADTADVGSSGFGLVGLKERVGSVRGSLESGRAPGGFRLAAHLPIEKAVAS